MCIYGDGNFFCVCIIHRLTQSDYVADISSVLFTLFIG